MLPFQQAPAAATTSEAASSSRNNLGVVSRRRCHAFITAAAAAATATSNISSSSSNSRGGSGSGSCSGSGATTCHNDVIAKESITCLRVMCSIAWNVFVVPSLVPTCTFPVTMQPMLRIMPEALISQGQHDLLRLLGLVRYLARMHAIAQACMCE